MEVWDCLACGAKVHVHCHYMPSPADLSNFPRHGIYRGSVILEGGENALKALLKLRRALGFAERFRAASLESQYSAGSRHWDLGDFLEFEVERARTECTNAGVNAQFRKLDD